MSIDPAAMLAAIALLSEPRFVKKARRMELPTGIPDLLRVAAGDPAVTAAMEDRTNCSTRRLRAAALFYVEQVMLAPEADSFRVLGATSAVGTAELRQHMALALRAFHPDLGQTDGQTNIDRSVFTNRLTVAWEDLKTDARRTSYLKAQANMAQVSPSKSRRLRLKVAAGPNTNGAGRPSLLTRLSRALRFRRNTLSSPPSKSRQR